MYSKSHTIPTQIFFSMKNITLGKDQCIYEQNTQIAKYIVGGTQKPFNSFTDTQYFLDFFYETIFLCIYLSNWIMPSAESMIQFDIVFVENSVN